MLRLLRIAAVLSPLVLAATFAGAQQSPTPQQPAPPTQRAPAQPPAPRAAPQTSAGQYKTEGEAKQHCPRDTVVWANTSSHVYHFAGNKDYGKTKQGAFMCRQESDRAGFQAAKNEKAPPAQ